MTYQTGARLPDEWGDALKRISDGTTVPQAVLEQPWLIEQLRELRRAREVRRTRRA